jgi:integrase
MKNRMQLTKAYINSIELKDNKQQEVIDLTEPTLRLIKYPTKLTFIARVFWKTKRYYQTLGSYPYISIPKARQLAAQFKCDVQTGEYNPKAQMSVKDFVHKYYKPHAINVAQNKTALECIQRLETHVFPVLGDISIGHVGRLDVTNFLNKRAEVVKNSTVNRDHSLLSGVFSLAVELNFISESKSPVKGIKKRKENNTNLKKLPTKEQVKALIELCNDNIGSHAIYDLLLLLIYTGMRVGEALSLRVSDIENDAKLIWLEENKSDRPVGLPANSQAQVILKRLIKNTHNDYLFPSPVLDNAPIIAPHRMRYKVMKLLDLKEFGFHYCRAIFCTAVAKKNAHMAQKLLNHSDIKTTNLYIYHDQTDLMQASEAVVELYNN